jgi:hypothetical protein
MNVLAMAATNLGKDKLACELVDNARRMAEAMDLIGVAPSDELIAKFQNLSADRFRAVAHTAWGTFSYNT